MVPSSCLPPFFSGGMIGMVAVGQVEGSIDGWKLAHMEPLINAIVLFAIAGCLSKLVLTRTQLNVAVYCLVGMAYSNTVFGYMRALTGALGYEFDDSLANNIATFAGMLGVPLAIIAFRADTCGRHAGWTSESNPRSANLGVR